MHQGERETKRKAGVHMMILYDLEWTQTSYSKRTMTQLSAVKVTDDWQITDRFDALIRPENPENTDWAFLAFNGHNREDFLQGNSEKETLDRFAQWNDTVETLICWNADSKRTLKMVYRKYYKGNPLPWQRLSVKPAVQKSLKLGDTGFYSACRLCGLQEPACCNCAQSDVELLAALLKQVNPNKADFTEKAGNPVSRRERNAAMLSKSQYNYVYAFDSEVFHKKTCWLIQNAKRIDGCIKYEKAIQNHRPCKVCKPEQIQRLVRSNLSKSSIKHPHTNRLLGGARAPEDWREIIGYCNNYLHPGKITEAILKEHKCVEKHCRFFTTYAQAPYWHKQEDAKAAKKRHKEERQQEENELERMKQEIQGIANEAGYRFKAVMVTRKDVCFHTIYYVSDNWFADGNRFPEILRKMNGNYFRYKFQLRHIKSSDGRFLTISEYDAVKYR